MDRDEFMELVYETFADEPDNVLANGIIEAADAYVEYEKAQLSKESTTSDLISRQAAIDAIHNLYAIHGSEGSWIDQKDAFKALNSLPSAQPEQLERCPIYDGVCGYPSGQCYDCPRHHGAQPEPQEGEWIPVHPLQGNDPGAYMCSKCKTGMWGIRPSSYHYCPNCGAKMTISTK